MDMWAALQWNVKVLKNPKRVNFAKCSRFVQSPDSDVCLFWLLLGLVFRLLFSGP